jgi:hypothetical protein
MERAVLHRTNDSFRATNPADEHLGPAPDDEDELEEPTVEEVWDGGRGEYVTVVTLGLGEQYTIARQFGGAFSGDYSIHGEGFYADGYLSVEKALDYLLDLERNR